MPALDAHEAPRPSPPRPAASQVLSGQAPEAAGAGNGLNRRGTAGGRGPSPPRTRLQGGTGGLPRRSQPRRRRGCSRRGAEPGGSPGAGRAEPRAGLRRRDSPSRSPGTPGAGGSPAVSLPSRPPRRGGAGGLRDEAPLPPSQGWPPPRRLPHLLGPPPPTGGQAPSSSTRRRRAGPCCCSSAPPLGAGRRRDFKKFPRSGQVSALHPPPPAPAPAPRAGGGPAGARAAPRVGRPLPCGSGTCSGEAGSGGRFLDRASRPKCRGRGPEAAVGPGAAGRPAGPACPLPSVPGRLAACRAGGDGRRRRGRH